MSHKEGKEKKFSFIHDKSESKLKKNTFNDMLNKKKEMKLDNYIVILDKSVDNLEMKKKLSTIFGIQKFEKTFVGNCERFLNGSVEIAKAFLYTAKHGE